MDPVQRSKGDTAPPSSGVRPSTVCVCHLMVLYSSLASLASAGSPAPEALTALLDRDTPCVPRATASSRICRIPRTRWLQPPADGAAWYIFAEEATPSPKMGDAPVSERSIQLFPGGATRSHLFGPTTGEMQRALTCEAARAAGASAALIKYHEETASFEMLGRAAMELACSGLIIPRKLKTLWAALSEEFLLAALSKGVCLPPSLRSSVPTRAHPSDPATASPCVAEGGLPLLVSLFGRITNARSGKFEPDPSILGAAVEGRYPNCNAGVRGRLLDSLGAAEHGIVGACPGLPLKLQP